MITGMRLGSGSSNSLGSVVMTTSPTPIRSEEPKRQTAREAMAANIQSIIEQLEAGHSEALTAYLNAISRFHNYSFGNVLEIARQKPDATHVAGLYTWNQLGRKVKKGERGIRILVPIVGVRRKPEEEVEKTSPSRTSRCSSASATRMFSIPKIQKTHCRMRRSNDEDGRASIQRLRAHQFKE